VRVERNQTTSSYSSVNTFTTRMPPDEEAPEEEITFGSGNSDGSGPNLKANDYRLVGLPGSESTPVHDLFAGNYGKDWKVFSDNGDAEDFLVEYSEDNPITFTEGKGYWVLSKKPLSVGGNIDPVQISEEDTYTITLKPGWNIISNPFTRAADWQQVQAFNQHNVTLFGYQGSFFESEELVPFHAYYVHNDTNEDMDLKIPYTSLDKRTNDKAQKVLKKSSSKSGAITLGIRTKKSEQSAQVRMIYDQDGKQQEKHTRYMPPLKLSRFGAAIKNEDNTKRKKLLYAVGDVFDRDRKHYTLEIKAQKREKITWSSEISAFKKEMAVLIVEPERGRSKIIKHDDVEYFMTAKGRKQFDVYTGSITELKQVQDELIPQKITLNQNYPNPFNPTTNIRFGIEQQSDVTLEVFNILGRKVRTLVNERMQKGWHRVSFDGSRLASGTYFYRLIVGQKIQTKKMVLIK